MTPEHRRELDRLSARPLGMPAARHLANVMRRQRVDQPRDNAGRWVRPELDAPPSAAALFGACFLIVLVIVIGLFA